MPRNSRILATFCFAFLYGVRVAGAADASADRPAIEARLSQDKLRTLMSNTRFSLPQLRVYDREGRLLHEFVGYDTEFLNTLDELVKSPHAPTDQPETLSSELAAIEMADGKALAKPPEADVLLVEYWADWCAPCHMQFDALVEYLGARPDLNARLLHVEADPTKLEGVEVKVLSKDPKP